MEPVLGAGIALQCLLLAFSLYVLYRYLWSATPDPREPPYIPQPLPFFGHLLGLIRYGTHYYARVSSQHRLEIYTLEMPHGNTYVVNSLDLVNSAQRNWKTLSFAPFIATFLKRLCVPSKIACDIVDRNLFAEDGPWGLSVDTHDAMHHALAPGPALNELIDSVHQSISQSLEKLLEDREDVVVDLHQWIRQLVTLASTNAVYGPQNPFLDADVAESFWEVEKDFPLLLVNIAANWVVPKSYRGRKRVFEAFERYYSSGGHQKGSCLTKSRYNAAEKNGTPLEDIAKFELSSVFGMLVNTVPCAFWVILDVFSTPPLLQELRETILKACEEDGTTPRTLNIANLNEKCPLLESIFQETLRTRTTGTSIRRVTEDFLLADHYLLKKDCMLQMPFRIIHDNEDLWGKEAKLYNPRRFIKKIASPDEKKSTTSKAGVFRGFGGGTTLCPGRHFASAEITTVLAMVATEFDIIPMVAGGWSKPTQSTNYGATSVLPPDDDIRVRIVRRRGVKSCSFIFDKGKVRPGAAPVDKSGGASRPMGPGSTQPARRCSDVIAFFGSFAIFMSERLVGNMNDEHNILNYYNLTTPYPTGWPAEKDDSEESEDEKRISFPDKNGVRRSKSRYSALERSGSDRRSLVPGSQKLRDGQENLVQKDEPDPLGGTDSVVKVLRKKGLPVEEDQRLRNRFLLSSTTFSPNLYLSQVHSNASTQELLQGLDFLSRSIDQKSASLKVLVESNFERFVRAKTTIDNVYSEMRNQGAEPEPERYRTHSRVTSRESKHYRKTSGQGPPTAGKGAQKPLPSDSKKHALTKESEYGVQGIKAPLIEVAIKAEEIWGPALGGREREESLKLVMESVEKRERIFKAGKLVIGCIKRKDYEGLVDEYTRARKYTEEARQIAQKTYDSRSQLTESQVHQIVITGRMWSEVEGKIEDFKRDVWRQLTSVQTNTMSSLSSSATGDPMTLISILLELGVDDNPIWVWLLSRYDYLKSKITATFERSRVEIEVLRRRLANADAPASEVVAANLKSIASKDGDHKLRSLDTAPVLELWDLIYNSLNNLLSIQGGILSEVIEFWDKAQTFIDGKAQKTLPIGIDGQSRKHHRLPSDGVRDLQNGTVELIDMLREDVSSFFTAPPIEDISMLYSPLPSTPITPQSAALSPYAHQDARFKFDDNNPPPPSPRRGEAWEDFAFWPPHANALSGVHYLEKLLTLLGTAASEMVVIRPVATAESLSDGLRSMVANARERSLRAACSAWSRDAEMCKLMEDWSRTSEQSDMTNMPSRLSAFESTILSGMQKILYIPEASNTKSGSVGVVSPPPSKLVQVVRNQFVASLYKALSGMVENAERSEPQSRSIETAVNDLRVLNDSQETVEGKSRNIRKLLTLSNLSILQSDIVPQLISQFEINFSTPLTDENKTIRDALSQIFDRLFTSYTKPTVDQLSSIVHAGISSPDWMPADKRPTEVRPYVYQALLLLVSIHTEVSTTAEPLTTQILSHLLEQLSEAFLHAFQQRARYPISGLTQATLDIEFVAQTMSQYTTKKASETQSQTYIALDERTTQEASKDLQAELPEMRLVLKRLREGTRAEFACFKRERGRAATQS